MTCRFTGACACGRITYECYSLPTEGSTICHCVTCRKLSGGAFHVYNGVATKQVVWHDRETGEAFTGLPADSTAGIRLFHLSNLADRGACNGCGSWLTMRYGYDAAKTYLTVSSIDLDSITSDQVRASFDANEEIFCSQRATWLDHKSKQKFERLPGDMEADMQRAV